MATHKGEIRYGVGFDVNRADLEIIKKEFSNLAQSLKNQAGSNGMTQELKQAIGYAEQLEGILDKSWNSKLGQLNLSKVNNEIKNTYGSIDVMKKKADEVGATQAFNKFASTILNTNTQIKQSNKLLNDMALTFKNTIRFGISSSVFNNMTSSIQQAFNYTKALDTSLNDIRIVTTKNADEMERFAVQANKAAKALGASTRDYTEGALIYYQQGLNDKETAARTDVTLKAANVTGQSGADVSEQLTAIWNGYKVTAEETELYVDKVAKVAATTAADLEEMATAMSKVASAANNAGVNIDQLNGMISTVVSVTREAPETIGTSFRTIFARLGDLSLGGSDEDGVKLGNISGKLHELGVEILNQQGDMRDMGDIVEDIAAKWGTWTKAQQQAAAVAMAGKMQYSRLIALFDNWDMYTGAVEDSVGAVGELQREQDIYMESTAAHLQKLKTESENTYDILFDQNTVNGFTDAMTGALSVFNEFLAGLGGGVNDFVFFGATIANIFKNQIGGEITRVLQNMEAAKANISAENLKRDIAQSYAQQGVSVNEDSAKVITEAQYAERILNIKNQISEEEYNQLTALQKQMGVEAEKVEYAEGYKKAVEEAGLKENSSLGFLKKREKIEKEAAENLKDRLIGLEEIEWQLRDNNEAEEKFSEELEEDLKGAFSDLGYFSPQDELTEITNLLAGDLEDQEAAHQKILELIEQEKQAYQEQVTYANQISDAVARREALESPEYQNAQNNLNAGNSYLEEREQQAERQKAITNLVQGTTTIVALMTTLSGIIKTVGDDSLTEGEKVQRVLITIAGALPMLITGAGSLITMLPSLAVAMGATGASMNMTAGAALKATVSIMGMKLALWEVFLIGAAVAAAIGALVAVGVALSNAYNADANAAKRANEAAKELKDSNEELTESFNQLKNSWEAYQTAEEKLENLTEGTQEWKDALKETNDAALELLNNLDGLSGNDIRALYNRDASTGKINIDDDAMQKAIDEQQAKVYASNLAVASGQAYATRAQTHSDLLDATRTNNSADHILARGILNDLTGPIGAFNNLTLGMREFNAELDRAKIEEHLDEFMEGLTLDEFQAKMDEIGVSLAGMNKTEIEDFRDNIEKMAQDADAASEKLKLIAQLQVDEQLGDEYDDTTKKIAADELTNRTQELTDEYLDKITGSGISKASGSGNKIYKQIVKDLQDAGYNYDKAHGQKAVMGTDSNRSFTFTDENGQEVERTAEWVAETVAASKAMEELSGNAKKASEALTNLDSNVGKELASGIKGFINNGNLENLTQSDLETLRKEASGDVGGYLSKQMGVSREELKNMLGDDYKENFKKAMEDYSKAFDKYTENFASSVKEALGELDNLDNLTVTQQKQLAKTLNEARKATPLDDSLMKEIAGFYDIIDSDELDEFADVLAGVTNWADMDVSELSKLLKEAGVNTDFTNDQLQQFIDNMNKVTNATKDFNSMAEHYGDIHKIIDGIERGDTISEEDYNTLGSAAEGYFTRMLDGTYKLTGDAEKFYKAVESNQIKDFRASLENQRKNIGFLEQTQQTVMNDDEEEAFNKWTKNQNTGSILSNATAMINGQKKFSFKGLFDTQADSDAVQQQLNLIDALGGNENLAKWQDALNGINGASLSAKDYQEIADAVKDCKGAFDNLDDALAASNQTLYENEVALLSSASSLEEMKDLAEENSISAEAYTQAWINLNAAQREEDLDAEEISNYAKYIREVADETDDFADGLAGAYEKGSEEAEKMEDISKDLATQILRMNKGVEDLADNWEDWSDILKHSSKGSEEYYKALSGTTAAMSDLLDISEDFISEDLILGNMEDIAKAAEGDGDAIDRLRAAAMEDIILHLELDDSEFTNQELLTKFQDLKTQLDAMDWSITPYIQDIEGEEDFVDTLNQMIEKSGMTADQVTNVLGSMGFTATFAEEENTVKGKIPVTTKHHLVANKKTNEDGSKEWDEVETVSVDYVDSDSTIGAFAMETSPKGTYATPKISSISKKASGSANNYSKKNAGGGSPGKSGGGSKKEAKTVDRLDDEADRYHKVNTQIQKVDNSLKKLQSQQDKFVGAALLDNLNKQWELLNTQVQNYNEKLKIAQGEQAELRAKLAGAGVQFNADGTISNYMQAFQAQLNHVNGLIAQYNNLSAEQQEQWDNNKTIDNAKEQFNKFKENMDRYDELVSDFIPGLQQDIQDAIDEQIEINIKKFNYEVEIKLDMSEVEREWNQWKKKVLDRVDEDDILGNAAARLQDFSSYYLEDNTGSIQVQTRHLSDLLDELDRMDRGLDNVYGDNRAQALEDLKNYYEQLMEDLEGVIDLQDEIHESYLNMMDEAQEKFDEQLDTYELITDTIEHDMKLIQMVMGDEAYTQLAKYYEAQQNNYDKQIDFQRQQVQFWRDQMETLEKGSDEWKQATDNWKDALKDWQSSLEDALENIRDKFENAIDEIFQKLNDKVTDGLGLDYVSEQWDLIDKKSESYLDTINALQGINNLESKYLESINNSTNSAAIKKLKAAMDDELNNLREQDRLTQADLDRAEKKYNLILAQIALEEAQQNKSQLRLRRDSQGNYTYQYAADDEAVNEAQNELGNMYADLYNFDKEQYLNTLDEIYDLYDEYQEKMAEAALINDPEMRAERELLIQEYYGELINGLVERNELQKLNLHESAFQDLAYLYDKDLESFTNLTETEKDLIMEDLIPQWDSGVQHMVDVFAGEGGFEEVTKRALQEIAEATAEYDDDLHQLAETAGVAFDDVCYGIDETIDFTNTLIDDNNDLIDSYNKQLDAVGKVIKEVDALVNKYNDARVAAEKATEAAYKYWQEQQRQAAAKAAATSTTSAGASGSGPNSGSGSSGSSGSGNGTLEVGDRVTYKGGGYYSSSYGGTYGNRGPGGQVTVTVVKNDGRPYPIHVTSTNSAYGWLRKDQLSGYDTGGYTGDWEGDPTDGRLALLHQKELVLNASDTKNLLDTVAIMRNITQALGANVLNRLAGVSAGKGYDTANETEIKQDVHIDAQFPNVRDAKEIEDALNNLVNVAAQRIYEDK